MSGRFCGPGNRSPPKMTLTFDSPSRVNREMDCVVVETKPQGHTHAKTASHAPQPAAITLFHKLASWRWRLPCGSDLPRLPWLFVRRPATGPTRRNTSLHPSGNPMSVCWSIVAPEHLQALLPRQPSKPSKDDHPCPRPPSGSGAPLRITRTPIRLTSTSSAVPCRALPIAPIHIATYPSHRRPR